MVFYNSEKQLTIIGGIDMKRPLLETEKNFLKCAGLMLAAGIGLVVLGENSFGIGSIVLGVVFAICATVSIFKNKDDEK